MVTSRREGVLKGNPIFRRGKLCRVPNPMSATGMKQGWNGRSEEESTERLKKPESAAQPGEASPVQVASSDQCAEGAETP
jgi:hypothetical protein